MCFARITTRSPFLLLTATIMGDSTTGASIPVPVADNLGSSLPRDASSEAVSAASSPPEAKLGGADADGLAEFGFQRPEFGTEDLLGTVQFYARHVFLCYKSPDEWPSHVESAEFDRLPRLLGAAMAARKGDMKRKTRLTICGGEDSTESSNGDVLIFPDMIRYRRLTHFDVDNFVEEALVQETEWLPGSVEKLKGSYIFVCSHGSRDRRCGVCGPILIKKFEEEISARGLMDQVFVSPCSHIGGHKYAGNVIIYSPDASGEIAGNWYGYVSPDDVPTLLEQHIGKRQIVTQLWRGQMGLSQEEQKKAHNARLQLNTDKDTSKIGIETDGSEAVNNNLTAAGGCCQGTRNSNCCQSTLNDQNTKSCCASEQNGGKPIRSGTDGRKTSNGSRGTCTSKFLSLPMWLENWEREDTYAAIAVVAAAASIAVAYSFYKQLK